MITILHLLPNMIYRTPTYASGFYIYKVFEMAKSVVSTKKISNNSWQKNLKYFKLIKMFSIKKHIRIISPRSTQIFNKISTRA